MFFYWKKVWVADATARRLASQESQDAMVGLEESADTPAEDPKLIMTQQRLEEEEEASVAVKAQALLKAGGLPEGAELELRSSEREGVAGVNKSPAGDVCDHVLVDHCAVLAVDWKPALVFRGF